MDKQGGNTMRARKKPVEIEFIQYDGFNSDSVKDFVGESLIIGSGFEYQNWENLGIKTLEGIMTVDTGDYIIKGVEGEFYPCKPGIFDKTYDILERDDRMKTYVVKVAGKYLKSFRMNRFGELTLCFSKGNEDLFWTTDKNYAKNVAEVVDGEVKEETQ